MADEKQPEKKTRLLPREVKFLRGVVAGLPIYRAAKEAGYSANSGWGIMERLKRTAPDLLDEAGLTMQSLIEDLDALRKATETKVFCNKGEVIYSAPLAALEIRRSAVDMAFKIHGAYAKTSDDKNGDTTINNNLQIINHIERPKRNVVESSAS
jgi:hypothetical protein